MKKAKIWTKLTNISRGVTIYVYTGKHDEDMKMSIMLGKKSLIMNINDYDDPTANQRHSPFKSKPKMPQKGRKRKG